MSIYILYRFQTDMAKRIRDKRSKKKKHILHEAKLILPKAVTKKMKKYNPIVEEEIPDEVVKTEESLLNTHSVCSCSTQYLNKTHSSNETNPDELASYFEQILFIPKPMSLMAELMYA